MRAQSPHACAPFVARRGSNGRTYEVRISVIIPLRINALQPIGDFSKAKKKADADASSFPTPEDKI